MAASSNDAVRLNKFLASCGIASRRKCDELIQEGRVEINGKIVVQLGTKVLPSDHVRFDGRVLRQQEDLTLILNKPKSFLCTRLDPEGRKTVYDLLPAKFQSVNYVGRLDYQSEGLLLLTTSGEFTELLTHPRYHVEKEYAVVLDRPFERENSKHFLEGIPITEGLAKAESVVWESRKRCRIVLTQGYNRQIRRMFSRFEYRVRSLERIRIGSFTDVDLPSGKFRPVNSKEMKLASTNPESPAS